MALIGSHCLPPGGGISGWALGGWLEPHARELTLFCSSLCSEAECLPTTDAQSTFVLFGVLETDHNWVFYLGKNEMKDWPLPHETLCTDATESRWDGLTRAQLHLPIFTGNPAPGSALQARCTEKGRLGSQGAYSLGGHRENLMSNGKRQCMVSTKIKAERKTRGLKEGYCGRFTQEVAPERVLGDIQMATHLVSHTRIFTILLWTLWLLLSQRPEKCPAPVFSYLPL